MSDAPHEALVSTGSTNENAATPHEAAVIDVHEVSVMLGGLPVLRSVSARVDAGQLVVLEGANGSGKTTLVRTILGLTGFQQGSVRLFGTDVAHFRDWSRVGYVPQRASVHLPHATVREVVATGRLATRAPFRPSTADDRTFIADALTQVGMAGRAGDAYRDLSGGQQQRVLIARALAGQARLLIMDEPLAGVDMGAQAALADVLGALKQRGVTQLIVLHELGALEPLIDKVIVLRNGRVLPPGTPHSHAHDHEVDWTVHDDPILPRTTGV